MTTPILLQRQAVKVLTGLLERATTENLPVISWRVSSAQTESIVTGECDASDPIQRRRDFEVWRDALNAEAWPGGLRHDGDVRLSASVRDTYDDVTITLAAAISADEMH